MDSVVIEMTTVHDTHLTCTRDNQEGEQHHVPASQSAAIRIQAAVRGAAVRKRLIRCPICLMWTCEIRQWPADCAHLLCQSCGLSWLRRSQRCPLCRGEAGSVMLPSLEGASLTVMLDEIRRARSLLWNDHLDLPDDCIRVRNVWLAISTQDGLVSEAQAGMQMLNLRGWLSTASRQPPPPRDPPRPPDPPPSGLVALTEQVCKIGVERYGEAAPAEVWQALKQIAFELWHWENAPQREREQVARQATLRTLPVMCLFVTGCALLPAIFVIFAVDSGLSRSAGLG